MKAVAVFLVTAALDVVWTIYVQALASKASGRAATCAGLLVLIGAFNTVSFVANPLLALPAACGAVVGTYLCTEWSKSRGGH